MFVVVVKFRITTGHSQAFLQRVLQQARDSLEKESECHVFDVCVDTEDDRIILLYEVYSDKAAFDFHLQSEHFKNFDNEVKNLVEEKVVEVFKRPLL